MNSSHTVTIKELQQVAAKSADSCWEQIKRPPNLAKIENEWIIPLKYWKTLWRFLQLIINTYNFPSASLWRCVDVCLSPSRAISRLNVYTSRHASGSRFNVPRMCHLTGELHALLQPSLSIWPLLIAFEIQLPSCHWIPPFNICLCMQLLLLWSLLLIAISFWCRGLISFVN